MPRPRSRSPPRPRSPTRSWTASNRFARSRPGRTIRRVTTEHDNSLYSLYTRGMALLEAGDYESASVPLRKAARLAPEKSSVREALGRALFRSRRFEEAVPEFEAVVERYPVNDYAHFCLGRALSLTGDHDGARRHL